MIRPVFSTIVRVFGLWALALPGAGRGEVATARDVRSVAECQALVRSRPRSLEGYACLLPLRGRHGPEIERFLDARLAQNPSDPRPRLYRALIREFGGIQVDEREFVLAARGFAHEGEVTGEIYALTSHLGSRCFGHQVCDDEVRRMLWRASELARGSGDLDLQRLVEIWRMKLAFAVDDIVDAEAAEARLLALGPPRSLWLQSEALQARAHLSALLRDYERQRTLYGELLEKLSPGDPRRASVMGGEAAAAVHLALRGSENREVAERLVREALAAEERLGLPIYYQENGYLASRTHLALLLGPTQEGIALARSALAGQLARGPWRMPLYAQLVLGELLATASPPRLQEAMQIAEDGVAYFVGHPGDFELGRSLLLRSRMHFRLGDFSEGRADGLAALDRFERLREQQRALPIRLRYAGAQSFAYHSLAGALLSFRGSGDAVAVGDAFEVVERLRARALMETLLAEGRAEDASALPLQPPSLEQIRAELEPEEAMLSFQLWRAEPTDDAPFREGTSWVTIITRTRVDAFPIPNADVLEPQIRAWTGLLERRDQRDRRAGARLQEELLHAALDALPPGVERLVLVPDGALHRLPFDALSVGAGSPYLGERFSISVQPSAALWLRFRAAPRLPPGRLLVLADPAAPSALQSVRRDATGVFGTLVHARHEAEVALSAFPAGSELRTGLPASESFLKSAPLDGVSMLHLATHAVTDEREPEHAAVVLAPGSASEDGRLEAREIARLRLDGKTVVLAGCETSAGPVFRGEGVMSLARAFFSAGATAVVGTLDRARDDEAGAFFSSMYAALARGATIGEAVTAAKRDAIHQGAPAAAWSGVVLLGDAQARPRAREPWSLLPLGLAVMATACAGVGVDRWRKRRHGGKWFG